MKITRDQIRRIIQEALPYKSGQPWSDPDMPVGRGARIYDDLDQDLTQAEEDEAGYFEEDGWPLVFGYTDKTGEQVEFVAHSDAESEEFFSMFFKEYGRGHPYSVNSPKDLGRIDENHHEGFREKALAAAQHAVKAVGYPQGGLIENEIHAYLEAEYGMDPMGEEIWSVADEALSIAGKLLGVGPDVL